jgi:hypothetical protein
MQITVLYRPHGELLQARVHLPSSEPKATTRLGPKGTFIALPWAEPKSIIVLVKPPENELALTPEGAVPGPLIMVRAKKPNASRIVFGAVPDIDREPPAGEIDNHYQPNAFAIAAQTAM